MTFETMAQSELESAEVNDRPHILIIDDDVDQASALSYRLQRQGFETHHTPTGLSGVQLAKTDQPNLIVLDVRLPDISGFQVCEQLADDPETLHIPVIIVTGTESADAVRRARAAGSKFYLRKPYDPNALLLLIRQALQDATAW